MYMVASGNVEKEFIYVPFSRVAISPRFLMRPKCLWMELGVTQDDVFVSFCGGRKKTKLTALKG